MTDQYTRPKCALKLTRLGIDTYKQPIAFIPENSQVCASEGFEAPARVRITSNENSIIATLNTVSSNIINEGEIALSEYAWKLLDAKEGEIATIAHPKPVNSLSFVRSKIFGNRLNKDQLQEIIDDITRGYYSDVHIASFVTACAGGHMNLDEIIHLTQAMTKAGKSISWDSPMVVDKHCVGGLPGNRTTPIIVPIVAAFGLTMPKTSSRAITSPAGTADTMEVLAPVELDFDTIQKVVREQNGCIAWGGSANLSPADDIIIRVEKAIDVDSEGQLVASVLSKKIAVGSTHVLIDIPVGPTAKVRSQQMAMMLKDFLEKAGSALNLNIKVHLSDGSQPVGFGIGPALEARDIVAVLQNKKEAPQDLRNKALSLAAGILEFSPKVAEGKGLALATEILDSGKAWEKFIAICEAQGGMREIPTAKHTHTVRAELTGTIKSIDNRRLALIAKLVGAPNDKAAGIDLHARLDQKVEEGDPLFTVHAESPGKLQYALDYMEERAPIFQIEDF